MRKLQAKYIRVERRFTGSFLNYTLDKSIDFEEMDDFVEKMLPGWDVVWGSMFPDDITMENNDG